MAAAIFDNYSRKCLYKSLATVGSAGYRIDMTNWGEFGIPVALKPAGFDAAAACARVPSLVYKPSTCQTMLKRIPFLATVRSPWRSGLTRAYFASLFLL